MAPPQKEYKLGIIGYPLSHSLSPVIQGAAFDSAGLSGTYKILETRPEDLVGRIKTLQTQGFHGFNVTIPHKVPVTLFLSGFDEFANLAGSVNTVKIMEDKTMHGYNTDVYGFLASLPQDFDLRGSSVAVLGTGGASRAICTAFSTLGVKKVDLYSRNIADACENAEILRTKFKNIEFKLFQSEILETLEPYRMVVNTTPVGMKSFSGSQSPLTDDLVATIDPEGIIYDLVYNPFKTELIKQAIRHNKKHIGGLDMFIYQGAKAFEIWTGAKPDFDKMKIAALENLV